jgi:hypothetical protein
MEGVSKSGWGSLSSGHSRERVEWRSLRAKLWTFKTSSPKWLMSSIAILPGDLPFPFGFGKGRLTVEYKADQADSSISARRVRLSFS